MARKMTGRVVSNKMDKTVVVSVERLKTHPIYKKQYKATARFSAHDENNQAKIGDLVEITECRPISKHKKFTITETLSSESGDKK